jgi:hypothetical protein
VVFLPVQAAGDPQIRDLIASHLKRAATVIMTPAFLRALGPEQGITSGIEAGANNLPALATRVKMGQEELALEKAIEIDAGIAVTDAKVRVWGEVGGKWIPLLTTRGSGRGRVEVFNIRTFSESDFQKADEWLLAPRLLGWVDIPQAVADQIRGPWLDPFRVRFQAPAGIGLYLYGRARLLYSFRSEPVAVRLGDRPLALGPHQWVWVD